MKLVDASGLVLPGFALRVICALESAGYEAWAVGGWVRDSLRGAEGHDVDVTTSAQWEQTKLVLESVGIEVHETGTAHGTVTAVVEGQPVEVTTYRTEGTYSDLRHPDEVHFVTAVREDLARRDFTINAMAYHPARGLLDPYGGREDHGAGVIRAVGEPERRFREDALRVLRAVRFACRLGFAVEPATQDALAGCAPELSEIASERIGQEMTGSVESGRVDWALLHETDVLAAAIPEVGAMRGFDQCSPYHAYDVLEHTAHVCRAVEEFQGGLATTELRWAAFLHDIAKPVTFTQDSTGRGHFFGHPKVGAQMAEDIMRRLALPTDLVKQVRILVRMHDHVVTPTPRSIRRTLRKFELACPGMAPRLTWELLDLTRAAAVSKVPSAAYYAVELDEIAAVLRQELEKHPPLTVRDLAVNGGDVIRETGMAPGPAVGLMLDTLLTGVLNDELPNEREALLAQLRWADAQ